MADPAPPGSNLRMSAALFLIGFATFSLIYCTQPLLPVFSTEFGISPATSSLSISLTTGFLAVSILCAGAGSEVLGRRGLMAASIGVAAVLNVLCAVAPSWTLLLILRAAEGFALGGVPAVAMAYIAEEVPAPLLGRVMGLYVGGTAFGGMAGRVAIGALAGLFSWRVAIGGVALLDLAAALAFAVLLPSSRHFVRRPGLNLRDHLSAWSGHLRHEKLGLLFLTGFLAMSAFVTVYNYAGFRLAAPPYGLDEAQIGLIFFAYVFGVVASPTAGMWALRIGRGPMLVIGAATGAAGLALTLLAPLLLIVAGVCLVTIGFFVIHSVASGAVSQLALRNTGHATSLYLLAYYAGSSVMGSFGGAVWRQGGWTAVVAYCLLMLVGVAAAGTRLSRQVKHGA